MTDLSSRDGLGSVILANELDLGLSDGSPVGGTMTEERSGNNDVANALFGCTCAFVAVVIVVVVIVIVVMMIVEL